MPGWDLLIAFAAATAVFAFMPGPALMYCAAQTLARGRRGGLLAALGVHLGGYVHVAAAALGLSAVFQHVPALYLAVKIVGAGYLVWLGIGIIRTRLTDTALPEFKAKSARRAFVESVSVEVLNPKAAMFFIAFLPQFADPSASLPVWAQMLTLGVVVNLAFGLADLVAVLLAATILGKVRQSGMVERTTRWLGGSIMIGLGAKLATDRT